MANDFAKDIALIEEAMSRFVQAKSRPRSWERIRQDAGVDLDRAGAALLSTLSHAEPEDGRLSDLAHRMGIEAPSVSRKVQQLESEGLLTRVDDPEDRRATVLRITPAGRELVAKVRQAHRQQFTDILRDWPAEDRTAFAKLFDKLSRDLESYNQEKPGHLAPQTGRRK